MDCRETLKISIRDNEATNNADINTALIVGQSYDYVGGNSSIDSDTTYLLSLMGSYNNSSGITANYAWTMSNGAIFSGQDISLALDEISPLTVLMTALDSVENCDANSSKVLFSNGLGNDCAVNILLEGTPINGYTLTVDNAALSGNAPYTYSWEINGSTNNNDTILVNGPGEYCLTITDAMGCESSVCQTINFSQNELVACSADFTYTIEEEYETEIDSLNLSKISIEYVDADGKNWRSDRANQTNNATFFQIDEVEEYERNENDEPTKKLVVRFNVTLFDEDLNELQLADVEGVIAVSY